MLRRRHRLALRGARRARRHRLLGLIAWRGALWYLRRRRWALRIAFAGVVAVAGAIRARRRPPAQPRRP